MKQVGSSPFQTSTHLDMPKRRSCCMAVSITLNPICFLNSHCFWQLTPRLLSEKG